MNASKLAPARRIRAAFPPVFFAVLSVIFSGASIGQSATEYGALGATTAAKQTAAMRQLPSRSLAAVDPGPVTPRNAPPPSASRLETRNEVPMCTSESRVEEPQRLKVGQSQLLNLPAPIVRRAVGDPGIFDAKLLSPKVMYLLGIKTGATNMILQDRNGHCYLFDKVIVEVDPVVLRKQITEVFPNEKVDIAMAMDSIVLRGTVSDAVKLDQIVSIAQAYAKSQNRSLIGDVSGGGAPPGGMNVTVGGGNVRDSVAAAGSGVINLLAVSAPQQVMLEVKVAEVSKTLLDKLGSQVSMSRTNGSWTYLMLSDFLTQSGGFLRALKSASKFVSMDGEKDDGVVRVLAEPNLMAISGQQASFLSGGKIFIPVAQSNPTLGGLATITLEEKEFGVGVKFTPTVLDGNRVNLKVASEVSELSQTGSPFTTVGGVTAVLPSMTTRKADTTVQLRDGQSFAIAGLIKNNLTETIKRYPVLGEVPVFGALFRSSEFQKEQTELLFVITPRLVKPLPPDYALPTDNFNEPGRAEFQLGGKLESGEAPAKADGKATAAAPAIKGAGGFDTK